MCEALHLILKNNSALGVEHMVKEEPIVEDKNEGSYEERDNYFCRIFLIERMISSLLSYQVIEFPSPWI